MFHSFELIPKLTNFVLLCQAVVNQVEKYKKMLNRSLPIPQEVKVSMCPFLVLEVRRDHLLEDAFHQARVSWAIQRGSKD
jgi:hypothetical protein